MNMKTLKIQPDHDFINVIKINSGSDLSTCMQCGSCSAVCELSPEEAPYPRKEMIWASWGLKELLLADPDIWLCHHCGDCTTQCPRGVKPGDVLAAIRQASWEHYSKPRFLSKWVNQPRYLPIIILIPAIIIAAIISLASNWNTPVGAVDYSAFFPHAWLNGSFSAIVAILLIINLVSIRRFSKNLTSYEGRQKKARWSLLTEIFTHKKFGQCAVNKTRKLSHLLVAGGFVFLLLVTAFAIVSVILDQYPMTFFHPVKIMGNLSGIAIIIGLCLMAIDHLKKNNKASKNQYATWFFLSSIFLLSLSGLFVEFARFGNWSAAYILYFFHLVMVWQVVFYLPFNKFAHSIYRTIAILRT